MTGQARKVSQGLAYYPDTAALTLLDRPLSPGNGCSSFSCTSPVPVNRLVFVVTRACNMACPGCYGRFEPRACGSLRKELFLAAINDVFNQEQPPRSFGAVFTGGEPLLHESEIASAIRYTEQRCEPFGIRPQFNVYTNATLIDDEFASFAQEHGVGLVVSLDGPKEVHDHTRPFHSGSGTYETVDKAIKKVMSHGLDGLVEGRAVIHSPTTDIVGVMEDLLSKGFRRIHLIPVYGFSRSLIVDAKPWLKALEVFEQLAMKGIVVDVHPFSTIIRNLARPLHYAGAHVPCLAGRSSLGVDVNGAYILCHHFSGNSPGLGFVGQGIPPVKDIDRVAPTVLNREPCCDCWARHLCAGPCFHRVSLGTDPNSINDCRQWLAVIESVIRCFVRLKVLVPQVIELIACDKVFVSDRARYQLEKRTNK